MTPDQDLPAAALPLHASLAPSAHVHAARELATPRPPLERELPAWFVAAVLVGWTLLAVAFVVWSVGAEVRGERELLERMHARSPERR